MIKIKLLLLSLIALPLASNAQVQKIVESYDNGQIKSITYENKETGLLEGHCVSYTEDGRLFMEEDYKDGLRDGLVKYYDAFGNIESIVSYSKGEKQGKLIKYQKMNRPCANPYLDYIENYENGLLQGMTYVYDDTGQKIIEHARYDDGLCVEDTVYLPKGTFYAYRTKGPDGTYVGGELKSRIVPNKKNAATHQPTRKAPVRQRPTAPRPVKAKPAPQRKPAPVTKPNPQPQPKPTPKPRLKVGKDGTIEMG
ncbi:toxin-antitoxin system YwqK family antitoxin [Prevotella sp.]